MSTPPNPYNRSYNFEDFQSLNPNSPLPAQHLENELNNIEETLDKTVSRLSEIQNADGSIKITGNIEQNITNTATSVATSVANQVASDYLEENFDNTAAATASSAANNAQNSAAAAANSAQVATLHSGYAEQAALLAQQRANQAAVSRNQSEEYADEANLSKISAKNSENNARDYQDATAGLYMSTLGIKNSIDSNLGKVVYKREDVNHLGANILFNGGDINNTLIEKIFPGTSFDSNAKLQQGQTIDNIGFNHVNGPWWCVGNAQPENPSDIITRDMMNCLVQTWKYWGPSVANGQMKPMSAGVNGEPNWEWHSLEYPQNIIQGIRYDQPDFNTNQMYPSQYADSVLTPWFVVQDKFTQAYSLAQTADSKADAALAQGMIPGPKGDTGDQGPQGIQGIQGIQGPVGPAGPQGIAGPAGQDGAPGQDGAQGPQGPAGQDGVGFNIKGDYDNYYTYSVNDYVTLNGSSYVLKGYIGAAGYDPVGWPQYWMPVALRGADGPQGPQGNDGSQGPQGPAGPYFANFRGYYDWYTTYNTGDIVTWDGSSYAALQYVSQYQYPLYGYPYWQLLASKGDTGPQGPQGEPGSGGSGIGEAPYDGNYYARQNNSWVSFTPGGGGGWSGIDEAPYNNYPHVRLNSSWSQIGYQSNGCGDWNIQNYYPYELTITINGMTMAVPARQIY